MPRNHKSLHMFCINANYKTHTCPNPSIWCLQRNLAAAKPLSPATQQEMATGRSGRAAHPRVKSSSFSEAFWDSVTGKRGHFGEETGDRGLLRLMILGGESAPATGWGLLKSQVPPLLALLFHSKLSFGENPVNLRCYPVSSGDGGVQRKPCWRR